MVQMGTTKRRRPTGKAKDPIAQQHEYVIQGRRDQRQADLARQKMLDHDEYVAGSTGDLLASLVFDAFPAARKTEDKTKTRVAINDGVRQLRIHHPVRYNDKNGIKIGQRIARDCLREAGNEIYGSGSHTPPSAR